MCINIEKRMVSVGRKSCRDTGAPAEKPESVPKPQGSPVATPGLSFITGAERGALAARRTLPPTDQHDHADESATLPSLTDR